MARLPDNIKDIDGTRETLKLAVRITDLWFVGTWDKSEQAEMVVKDSHNDKIHVAVRKDQLKSWKSILREGSSYMMHNFKVTKNEGQYRVCLRPYKLTFTGVTVIRETELPSIPFRTYEFVPFQNIIRGNFERGLLVDVIGIVHEFTFQHVGSENTRCVFTLKDLSGESVTCTLWEEYCLKFLEYLGESNAPGPIIIVLTHARIKEPQGTYPAAVSNSLKASKLLINAYIPEISDFIQRLGELNMTIPPVLTAYGQGGSQVSGSSQFSQKDKFLYKAEVKTLSEINTISEEIVCVTVGTIGMIVADNHGWCYASCVQCNKSARTDDAGFTCKCGKYNKEPLLRYRVEVMVYHKDQSAKFLLWDRECMELIGQAAAEINKLKIEGGDDILNISPKALDKMLGCSLAFKIKTQPKFKNSSFLKISHDTELMKSILELLPDAEAVGSFPLASNTQDIAGISLEADNQISDKTNVSLSDVKNANIQGKTLCDSNDAEVPSKSDVSVAAIKDEIIKDNTLCDADNPEVPSKSDVSLAAIKDGIIKGSTLCDADNPEKCVSLSADHDPAISLPVTPTKRHSSDSLGSDDVANELLPAQMSSNKMGKRTRQE